MGKIVLDVLREGLKASFTPEAEAAFGKLFAYLQAQMQKGGAHD